MYCKAHTEDTILRNDVEVKAQDNSVYRVSGLLIKTSVWAPDPPGRCPARSNEARLADLSTTSSWRRGWKGYEKSPVGMPCGRKGETERADQGPLALCLVL